MTRSGLVFVIGALAAGGAIGYVVGAAGGDPAAEMGAIRGAEAPAEPAEPVVIREPAPAPSGGGGGGSGYLEEFFASLELSEEETSAGNGKLTGVVRDEDGRPMEGVLVRATRQPERQLQTRATSALKADVVVLKNGHEIQGEVLRETATEVVVRFPGGILRLKQKQVDRVERQSRLTYLLEDAE